jgi:hypothetical protein
MTKDGRALLAAEKEMSDLLDVLEDLLEYAEEFQDAGCWHLHQTARAVELLERHGRRHRCSGRKP